MNTTKYNPPVYSIGAVARMLEVSVETLRLYDRKGLIIVHKSRGNQREYTPSDVERLRCIRSAINEHKISIEGIRHIHSMIPCWEYASCPVEQRLTCPAYNTPEAGCWTYKHEDNACRGKDCKACDVYLLSSDCNAVKQMIIQKTSSPPAPLPKGL